jgi:hypothetical protein
MVAEAVVDRLEMIRVDDEQGADRRLADAPDFEEVVDDARECAAIEAAGETVFRRQVAQPVIGDRQFAQFQRQVEEQRPCKDHRDDGGADQRLGEQCGAFVEEIDVVERDRNGDAAERAEHGPLCQLQPTAHRYLGNTSAQRPTSSPRADYETGVKVLSEDRVKI